MANIVIRDLDPDVVERLKEAAKANGRSLQAEIHNILTDAPSLKHAEMRRISEKWLRRLKGTKHSDSVELIREDRDR